MWFKRIPARLSSLSRWLTIWVVASGMIAAQTYNDVMGPARNAGEREVRPKSPTPPKPLPIPDDAVKASLIDLLTFPQWDRRYIRYLFIQDMQVPSMRTSSLILNYVSRSQFVSVPPVVNGFLLRIDLQRYVRDESDLREWVRLWEDLAFDPMFSRLITKDTLRYLSHDDRQKLQRSEKRTVKTLISPRRTETITIDHPGGKYVYPDDSERVVDDIRAGRYEVVLSWKAKYRDEIIEDVVEDVPTEVDVIRLDSKAIDPIAFRQLQAETHSLAPVTDHLYFKLRVFNSLKFKGLYNTIYGGRYYEFAGLKTADERKIKDTTDLDTIFFFNLGIGDSTRGSADRLFDVILKGGDRAVVKDASEVTGNPREALAFHVPVATHPNDALGVITGDVRVEDVDFGDHPAATLLKPRRQGREGIFPKLNGLHYFIATNGDNKRVDAVPQEIANDRTVPSPHPPILTAGISCFRCHSIQGESGWQPITNDIMKLTSGRYGLDIFDDRGDRKRFPNSFETVNRLAGKYKGQINFDQARNSLVQATLKSINIEQSPLGGIWWEGTDGVRVKKIDQLPDQTTICKLSAERVASEWTGRVYTTVKAKKVLHYLGIDTAGEETALGLWRMIITPDPKGANGIFIEEDFRVGAIATGVGLGYSQWDLVRDFVAERAQRSPIYQQLRQRKSNQTNPPALKGDNTR